VFWVRDGVLLRCERGWSAVRTRIRSDSPASIAPWGEGTASRLELFFDLAYVLVVMELAKVFYEDLT
jgi:low temperature requirement protein LtrA